MNVFEISNIAGQIGNVSGRIKSLSENIEVLKEKGSEDLASVYESQLLDEVTHAQILVLELTRSAAGEELNGDEGESAFMAGELTDTEGKKEVE